jgi:hypothetical protein
MASADPMPDPVPARGPKSGLHRNDAGLLGDDLLRAVRVVSTPRTGCSTTTAPCPAIRPRAASTSTPCRAHTHQHLRTWVAPSSGTDKLPDAAPEQRQRAVLRRQPVSPFTTV